MPAAPRLTFSGQGLALPRIGRDVPFPVRLNADKGQLHLLARVILEEEVLREEDWAGDLDTSVLRGFDRWLDRLGLRQLEFFPLNLSIREDAYSGEHEWAEMEDPDRWIGCNKGVPGMPVSAFALDLEAMQLPGVCAGRIVTELERFQRGAGISLFGLLNDAMVRTVDAATPAWAYWRLNDWEDFDDDPEDEDVLTPARFLELIPERIINARFDRDHLAAALRPPRANRGEIKEHLQRVVRKALEVADLPIANTDQGHEFYCSDRIMPLSLFWRPERDPMMRFYDDYLEMIQQGDNTDVCWIRGWQYADPESIRAAVRDLKALLASLKPLNELLQLVHAPGLDPLNIRWNLRARNPLGVPLVKVFAEAERVRVTT